MFFLISIHAAYFLLGGLIFNHILKPPTPDYTLFFGQKQVISSSVEGLTTEIKKIENGWAYCRVELKPHADGPPEHVHEHFDELFTVEKGVASLLVNGDKKLLRAGESMLIPKGTPHKPFNETDEVVILNDSSNLRATMPASFAYGLAQLYPAMDRIGDVKSFRLFLVLAALGNTFDTWKPRTPLFVQKAGRWLLAPTARLMGYGR